MIKKFSYAPPNTFLYKGQPYTGYFNVVNNTAYAGKYTQSIVLDNVNNVQNFIETSDLFFNRLPTENATLTFSLSDFVFQPNEFINANSIDNKLSKAYRNFIDAYMACFMVSSDLPYNMTFVAKVSGDVIGWVESSTGTIVDPLSTLNSNFSRSSKIAYIESPYDITNTLIVANTDDIAVFKVNPITSTFNVVFSSGLVQTGSPDYGSLKFGNISSISKFNSNFYVCDSLNRSIYSYDISSVIDGDRALGNKFNLKKTITNVQGDFTAPVLVGSSQNTVFVYDEYTNTVLFFDTGFNLINGYKNEKLFTVSKPVSLTYYRIYDQLYVLTEDLKLVVLDNQANATIIQLSRDGIETDEVGQKVIFSNSESDVMYLLTNKNLYKKFVSNIIGNIGKYSFVNRISGTNTDTQGTVLYDIDVLENMEKYDDIMLYGFDQFINYNEQTVYNSIIK
jgi:hypothetical protein